MPEISRARQRALARETRKYGPIGYSARQLAAVAVGVFVAGAAIGTTAGLLIGGGGQGAPAEVAERPSPAAITPPPETAGDPSRGPEDTSTPARVPTSGYTSAPEPAGPVPEPETAAPDAPRQAERTAAAPTSIPRIPSLEPPEPRADGAAPAWRRNAAAFPQPGPGTGKIAIVIDDLGLNRPNAREMLALPGPLTLAFMTYAPSPGDLTQAAREAGHELLVHVPMQPSDDGTDPGPRALSGALDRTELLARLDWGLSRFDGYVGINNHMGSAFTRDAEGMRAVLGEIKRRGLMFLDSRTIAGSVAGTLAEEMGVAHASRDVFLDNQRDVAAIRAQLAKAERIARETGSAVAIGHPYDETIQALRAWLPTLAEKKIALVPISALAKGRGPDVARLPAAE